MNQHIKLVLLTPHPAARSSQKGAYKRSFLSIRSLA